MTTVGAGGDLFGGKPLVADIPADLPRGNRFSRDADHTAADPSAPQASESWMASVLEKARALCFCFLSSVLFFFLLFFSLRLALLSVLSSFTRYYPVFRLLRATLWYAPSRRRRTVRLAVGQVTQVTHFASDASSPTTRQAREGRKQTRGGKKQRARRNSKEKATKAAAAGDGGAAAGAGGDGGWGVGASAGSVFQGSLEYARSAFEQNGVFQDELAAKIKIIGEMQREVRFWVSLESSFFFVSVESYKRALTLDVNFNCVSERPCEARSVVVAS